MNVELNEDIIKHEFTCDLSGISQTILQENIGSDMVKWFMDKKSQLKITLDTLRKYRIGDSKNVSKWAGFPNVAVEMPISLSVPLQPFNNKFNINDVLSAIGIELKGDIFRKYYGEIPIENMRSVVIAGTFKNDIEYFKGMILSQLYNLLIPEKNRNVRVIQSVSLENVFGLMSEKYVGITSLEEVNSKIFMNNTRAIPLLILQNSKTLQSFEKEMRLLIENINDAISNNPTTVELPIFLNIFEYISKSVVEMILHYNEILLSISDIMNNIYNDFKNKEIVNESAEGLDMLGYNGFLGESSYEYNKEIDEILQEGAVGDFFKKIKDKLPKRQPNKKYKEIDPEKRKKEYDSLRTELSKLLLNYKYNNKKYLKLEDTIVHLSYEQAKRDTHESDILDLAIPICYMNYSDVHKEEIEKLTKEVKDIVSKYPSFRMEVMDGVDARGGEYFWLEANIWEEVKDEPIHESTHNSNISSKDMDKFKTEYEKIRVEMIKFMKTNKYSNSISHNDDTIWNNDFEYSYDDGSIDEIVCTVNLKKISVHDGEDEKIFHSEIFEPIKNIIKKYKCFKVDWDADKYDYIITLKGHINKVIHESTQVPEKIQKLLVLIESQQDMLDLGMIVSPLTESVNQVEYAEYLPLLESIDDIRKIAHSAIDGLKEDFRNKNIDNIKSALGKLKDYMFKLDPQQAKHFLPAVIKYVTVLAIGAAMVGAATPTLVTLGVTEASLAFGAISSCIHLLADFLEIVVQNKFNQDEADKTRHACEEEIKRIDSTIAKGTTPANEKLLQVYKVRLNTFIAELEESKIQKTVVGQAKEKITNMIHQESASIMDDIEYDYTLQEGVIGDLKDKIKKKFEPKPKQYTTSVKASDVESEYNKIRPLLKKFTASNKYKNAFRIDKDSISNIDFNTAIQDYSMRKRNVPKNQMDIRVPVLYVNFTNIDKDDQKAEQIYYKEIESPLKEMFKQFKYLRLVNEGDFGDAMIYLDTDYFIADTIHESVYIVNDIDYDYTLNEGVVGNFFKEFGAKLKEKFQRKANTSKPVSMADVSSQYNSLQPLVKKFLSNNKYSKYLKVESQDMTGMNFENAQSTSSYSSTSQPDNVYCTIVPIFFIDVSNLSDDVNKAMDIFREDIMTPLDELFKKYKYLHVSYSDRNDQGIWIYMNTSNYVKESKPIHESVSSIMDDLDLYF